MSLAWRRGLTVPSSMPNFTPIGATCYRFDTIPACDRRTDRQTDGRNCYSYYSACNASVGARCNKMMMMMVVVRDRTERQRSACFILL